MNSEVVRWRIENGELIRVVAIRLREVVIQSLGVPIFYPPSFSLLRCLGIYNYKIIVGDLRLRVLA